MNGFLIILGIFRWTFILVLIRVFCWTGAHWVRRIYIPWYTFDLGFKPGLLFCSVHWVFWVFALGVSSEKNPRPFWAAKDVRKKLEAAQRSQFRSRNQWTKFHGPSQRDFHAGSTGCWIPWSSQMSFSPISPASSSSEQTPKLIGCIHDIWSKAWCPQQNHHYIYRMGPPR